MRLPPICRHEVRASVAQSELPLVVLAGVAEDLRLDRAIVAVGLRKEGRGYHYASGSFHCVGKRQDGVEQEYSRI